MNLERLVFGLSICQIVVLSTAHHSPMMDRGGPAHEAERTLLDGARPSRKTAAERSVCDTSGPSRGVRLPVGLW